MQYDDFISFARGSMENEKINDVGLYQTFKFYSLKLIYYTHRIFLPIYLGRGIFSTLFLFGVTEAIGGLLFGYFSQITHVSEDIEWPSDKPIPGDWATLQVRTAADYAPDSFFWTYLSGYLNYQIVHHLFPSVAPHHYHELLPIVRETCKEFNIKYIMYDDIWQCISKHYNHLETFQCYRERYYDKLAKNERKTETVVDKIDFFLRNFLNKK